MNKYPPIGVGILTVVLLVLGSLSNVVGYQSVKSTVVNDSPLFSVRTQRATNQASEIVLISDYLGKGTGNLLQFPMRDNRTKSLKRAIEIISKMDDKTFQKLFLAIRQHLKETTYANDKQLNEIYQGLNKIKNRINIPLLLQSPRPITDAHYGCTSLSDLITCILFYIDWILDAIFSRWPFTFLTCVIVVISLIYDFLINHERITILCI